MSLVLARDSVVGSLSGIASSQVKLGLKGYAGNKGAIAFRFEILGESICVINVHLAAHKQNCKLRNDNLASISKSLRFTFADTSKSIFEHDYIFLFGDLNYRINSLSTKKIIENITVSNFEACLMHDQLNIARKSCCMLTDFKEGEIDFIPTFKYMIGSNQHNVRRDPAWCDRVLWKGQAHLHRYGSCDSIKLSDHKPVFAHFGLCLKKKDITKMNEVKNLIYKEIDALHHEAMPRAELSVRKIVFDEVRYKQEYRKSFEITNTGKSNFYFEIHDEKWIKCAPKNYHLVSQESVLVSVRVQINSEFLKERRELGSKIANFLRIRIMQGPEYYIELEYTIYDSFIGHSCEALCLSMPSAEYYNLPSPLVRIIEYLRVNALRVKNLFDTQIDTHILANVIMKIDKNEEFDSSVDVWAAVAALNEFLKHLPSPILDAETVDGKIQMIHIIGFNNVRLKILEGLQPANAACLKYITDFMKTLIGNSIYNGVSARYLANAMHQPIFQVNTKKSDMKANRIQFLEMFFYGG